MIKRNERMDSKNSRLLKYSSMDINELLKSLKSSPEGIEENEARKRLERYGRNEVSHEKPLKWYSHLLRSFINPFIGILVAIGLISLVTDVIMASDPDFKVVIVVTTMVLISGILRFSQEYRSTMEAENLKKMVKTTATVIRRDSGKREVEFSELVPGDLIHLSAGDMVPADVRIISAKDLFVSQSVLTGESEPVEKFHVTTGATGNIFELENICFMGTNVVSGSALAVVIFTGNSTQFGTIVKDISGRRPVTSFEKGVNSVSWLLIRFMVFMVPVVFIINGITKGDWVEALLFAVSIAVGLTPEMLPMIVTTNLARGAMAMARKKTIVKRIESIQNFGAMDVLCTDKTGTLTLDRVVLELHLDIHGREDERVLRYGYLNSSYQTGLKNLMDEAIIEFGDERGFNEIRKNFTKIDEIPFDFSRRRMSVILNDGDDIIMVTKGAVEEMLQICSAARYNEEIVDLTGEIKDEVKENVTKLNMDGFRVLAVAEKRGLPPKDNFTVDDEDGMVLVGYLAFLDPPKESASKAIAALRKHGVEVKIITGDNEHVTGNICRRVGLEYDRVLFGHEIEDMTLEEISEAADDTAIFAKVSPLQKAKIIRALKMKHTVGFLGDGINDSPALREADVGISVDSAVDVAKESADIILLEKSLMVLERGVLEGRRTFGNIMKYIKMTASSNFGNVFSVLVASAFLPFLPMMPVMLLLQNLLYDISQISIPWDGMDPEFFKVPRKWDASDLGRFMILIGPISSIFDIVTYLVMWFVFSANTVSEQALFQSGWFIEGLLSQTLIVHMIRTEKIPFIQSRAATPVLILTALIMATGIIVPFTAIGSSIGMVPLPGEYFIWLVVILTGYAVLTQVLKRVYIGRYGKWL
ncbi:magnesium-translocating P-type ATPase [Methanothermobacter sp.]|uniref:magnesium-translocating P-type ATPase n=1 Tax=Methanothermobacter sp. TaxID=1884223 RepID=UPI0026316538|nr:magnesium-translocating P-type ATPase [Methanothermobacter sp.]MDI9614130.1 magnesium-translocating P-type ATPase [Methanothermobacter sp.]